MNAENYDCIILFHRGGLGDSIHDLGIIDALIRNGAKKIIYISSSHNDWLVNNFTSNVTFIEANIKSLFKNIIKLISILLSNHLVLFAAGTNISKINRLLKSFKFINFYATTNSIYLPKDSNRYLYVDTHTHRIDANKKLLEHLGMKDCNTKPKINLDRLIEHKIKKENFNHLNNEKFVICHNGSDKNLTQKKIEHQNFLELLAYLMHDLNLRVLLLGGENEIGDIGNIGTIADKNLFNYVGKTNLYETIYIISKSSYVIGSDSMIGHIAAALDIPTVSFFGPTDPKIVKPYSNFAHIISHNLSCSPCYLTPNFHSCPHHYACMKNFNLHRMSYLNKN